MTLLTNYPDNPNYLHANKFRVSFSRLPHVEYFCQSINVPGISVQDIPRTTPFVELYSPGDKAIYDIFGISFILDEEMICWTEIHDWIRAMTFPTKFEEYVGLKSIKPVVFESFPQFSDATVTILTSDNNPKFTFNFVDVFPISLSSFILTSTQEPSPVVIDAIFRYSYYNLKRV